MIDMYTRPGCSRCVVLKNFLRSQGVEYKEYIIDEDVTRDEVVAKFPGVTSLPIVVYKSVLTDSDALMLKLKETNI